MKWEPFRAEIISGWQKHLVLECGLSRKQNVCALLETASEAAGSSASGERDSHASVQSSEVVAKQSVPDVGVFTAFEDRRIRVRFADRTLVAVDRWHRMAEVVHRDGTTTTVAVSAPHGASAYVTAAMEFGRWALMSPADQRSLEHNQRSIAAAISASERMGVLCEYAITDCVPESVPRSTAGCKSPLVVPAGQNSENQKAEQNAQLYPSSNVSMPSCPKPFAIDNSNPRLLTPHLRETNSKYLQTSTPHEPVSDPPTDLPSLPPGMAAVPRKRVGFSQHTDNCFAGTLHTTSVCNTGVLPSQNTCYNVQLLNPIPMVPGREGRNPSVLHPSPLQEGGIDLPELHLSGSRESVVEALLKRNKDMLAGLP